DPAHLADRVAIAKVPKLLPLELQSGRGLSRTDRHRVDQGEKRRRFSLFDELRRHLVGEGPREAVAAEQVRALGLERTEFGDVVGGHVDHAQDRLVLAVETLRLKTVHRLVRIEGADKISVVKELAVSTMQEVERRTRPAGPQRNERCPEVAPARLP